MSIYSNNKKFQFLPRNNKTQRGGGEGRSGDGGLPGNWINAVKNKTIMVIKNNFSCKKNILI